MEIHPRRSVNKKFETPGSPPPENNPLQTSRTTRACIPGLRLKRPQPQNVCAAFSLLATGWPASIQTVHKAGACHWLPAAARSTGGKHRQKGMKNGGICLPVGNRLVKMLAKSEEIEHSLQSTCRKTPVMNKTAPPAQQPEQQQPEQGTAQPAGPSDSDLGQADAGSCEKRKNPEKTSKNKARKERPAALGPAQTTARRSARKRKKQPGRRGKRAVPALGLLLIGLEGSALVCIGSIALMVALGLAAEHLSGTSFLHNRLPFALATLAALLAGMLVLHAWIRLRRILASRHAALAPLLALIACIALLTQHGRFAQPLEQFRLLVGGKAEIHTLTIRHQIFAAYRRLEGDAMARMFLRAQVYTEDIEAASRAFALDPDLLNGLAAAESSFYPRSSADGGQGLFQLTSIPSQARKQALERLGTSPEKVSEHRLHAFLAAATLRHYLAQMNDNMVLGVLAYNIGPANGGLRHIMQRYSATDFTSIQPYLKEKPRNYPIRVLAFALAFRVNRVEHRLLPYEEGHNAVRVQHIGIPGL